MKQRTIYKVTVNPQAAASEYEGFFLQCPDREELGSAISDEIERLENQTVDDDDRIGDRISDLKNALQVADHAGDFVGDFVPPLFGQTELRVTIASIVVGEITIEAVEAYGRDPRSVLEQLVA